MACKWGVGLCCGGGLVGGSRASTVCFDHEGHSSAANPYLMPATSFVGDEDFPGHSSLLPALPDKYIDIKSFVSGRRMHAMN